MDLYNVWDPSLISREPPVLCAVVTFGESTQIADGTDEFVEELLSDVGIDAKAKRWKLRTCRSSYYTEYSDSDDWQDRWLVAWKVEIELAEPVEIPEPDVSGYFTTEAWDASWTDAKNWTQLESAICLVVADFEDDETLEKAEAKVKARLKDEKLDAKPVYTHAMAMGKYPQLQVELGEFPNQFFEDDAPLAKDVIAICAELGGCTSRRETLRLRNRDSS